MRNGTAIAAQPKPEAQKPHAQTSHSTRVSSFSLFISLAFLLAGVALQRDVVFCCLRS